jgi:PAS domain S-box-containing protein
VKRPYITPSLAKLGPVKDLPESLQGAARELLSRASRFTVITTRDHYWVHVSEDFASLLGYTAREIIGKTVDQFTSPGSIDVEFAFEACFRLGEGEGMWLFDRRNGSRILVNYHAHVSNQHSLAHIRPLLITETWTTDSNRISGL